MRKGRPIFRLLAVGLVLALLPTGCCCDDAFASDHHDAGANNTHYDSLAEADHDALARRAEEATTDCVTAHEETAACQVSLVTTNKANRLPGSFASTGPNSIAIRLWPTAMPDSVPATMAAASLRQPARLPPRTLVALQVLHLT